MGEIRVQKLQRSITPGAAKQAGSVAATAYKAARVNLAPFFDEKLFTSVSAGTANVHLGNRRVVIMHVPQEVAMLFLNFCTTASMLCDALANNAKVELDIADPKINNVMEHARKLGALRAQNPSHPQMGGRTCRARQLFNNTCSITRIQKTGRFEAPMP